MDQNTLKTMIDDLEYRKAELIDQRGKTDDAIEAIHVSICITSKYLMGALPT